MALPTLIKTYEFDINRQGGISSDSYQDCRRTMFAMKEALTSSSFTSPMTVSRSSDSVSAGAADYWLAYTDIVVANVNHSWIVLKSQGTVPYEICIDMQDATPNYYQLNYVGVSMTGSFNLASGGTDGTISARPTAPDEVGILGSDSPWAAGLTGAFLSRIHCIMSTDGDTMTLVVHFNNTPCIVLRFDVLQNPTTGFVDGIFVWMNWHTTVSNAASFSELTTSSSKWTYDNTGSRRTALPSYEAYNSTPTSCAGGFGVANDWDGEWPFYPLGCWTAGTRRGRVGTMTDMWLGSTATNEGDAYPDVPTLYQFMTIGDLILPWDSASPLLTS